MTRRGCSRCPVVTATGDECPSPLRSFSRWVQAAACEAGTSSERRAHGSGREARFGSWEKPPRPHGQSLLCPRPGRPASRPSRHGASGTLTPLSGTLLLSRGTRARPRAPPVGTQVLAPPPAALCRCHTQRHPRARAMAPLMSHDAPSPRPTRSLALGSARGGRQCISGSSRVPWRGLLPRTRLRTCRRAGPRGVLADVGAGAVGKPRKRTRRSGGRSRV